MLSALDLDTVNAALRARGVKLKLVVQAGRFFARGTVPRPDGSRSQQRISLSLPADPGSLVEAELRVLRLWSSLQNGSFLVAPLPWAAELPQLPVITSDTTQRVCDATRALEQAFWQGRIESSAAHRTWDRIQSELKRLPAGAALSTELLVGVAAGTAAGSRSRLECCKVFKRLGKIAGLPDVERLDLLRTSYEPGERELPDDSALLALVEATRSHAIYGWCTAALVVYGCRPAEVFSLQPATDGTAKVLSVKRKGKLPTWRTALALPKEWVEQFELQQVQRRWDCISPAIYDSLEAKRLTQAWGHWLKRQAPGLQLYDIRHAWAVRSIRKNLNASLAAKCLGHSLAVHHSTYHRWLEQSDVAAAAALL